MNELRKLQISELKMLEILCGIFERKGYKYFALGGTVLGAIRHKGFIPWDDDIDIGLYRDEFEKMEKEIIKELPREILYYASEDNSIIKGPIGKFYYNNDSGKKIEELPSIDIFPLDNMANNKICRKIQLLFSNIYHLSVCQRPAINRGKVNFILTKIILKIFPKSFLRKIAKLSKKVMLYWNNKKTKEINNFFGSNFEIVPQECFENLKEVFYEKKKIKIPEKYDLYLKILYGDYMKLPPLDQRRPKHKKEIV